MLAGRACLQRFTLHSTTANFSPWQVMDCQNPDISVMDAKLFFRCVGEEGKQYELDLELLRDINTKVGVAASVAFLLQNMCPPGFGGLLCYPLELV